MPSICAALDPTAVRNSIRSPICATGAQPDVRAFWVRDDPAAGVQRQVHQVTADPATSTPVASDRENGTFRSPSENCGSTTRETTTGR